MGDLLTMGIGSGSSASLKQDFGYAYNDNNDEPTPYQDHQYDWHRNYAKFQNSDSDQHAII